MVTVTLKMEWDMGHRLPEHLGKCKRVHGHRYVAEVDATGEVKQLGAEAGMVIDFDRLKPALRGIIDQWDHRFMLYARDPLVVAIPTHKFEAFGFLAVPFMPTAENIAIELLRRLRDDQTLGVEVTRVRVYETPNGWAEVTAITITLGS